MALYTLAIVTNFLSRASLILYDISIYYVFNIPTNLSMSAKFRNC